MPLLFQSLHAWQSRKVLRIMWPALAKPVLWLGIFLSTRSLDSKTFEAMERRWPVLGPATIETHLATWDAAHYLHLAINGYHGQDPSCAFYPLWPQVLRLVFLAIGTASASVAWIVGVGIGILAYALFAYLLMETVGEERARRALLLHIVAPGSLFMCANYSEPLFLLLSAACFLALRAKSYPLAVAVAFLLPLTRAVGVFVVMPLAWHALTQPRDWRRWLLLLSPVAGYFLYFAAMRTWTGDAFTGFTAQQYYPNQPSIANILNLRGFLEAFLNGKSFHGMLDSVLDRTMFIFVCAAIPAVWRIDREWFWWALFVGIVPAMTNFFFSYTRFAMMVFPVYAVWASWLDGANRRVGTILLLTVSAIVQAELVHRYINFRWAG